MPKNANAAPASQAFYLKKDERDTILAALRYWQNRGSKHQPMEELEEIATNGGAHDALTADEIDRLCEDINA